MATLGLWWHYCQPNNDSFSSKLESIQCNAALVIIGIIQVTSKSKFHRELGLEYLIKVAHNYDIPSYLAQLLPTDNHSDITCNCEGNNCIPKQNKNFQVFFFPIGPLSNGIK